MRLSSVFKLSPPTLMLTDIELCKDGMLFLNLKRKEIVLERSTQPIVFQLVR